MKKKSLRDSISRPLTIIFIPHHSLKPLRINLTGAFLLFCLTGWFILTSWAVYLAVRHFDYWMVKANNLILKTKTLYFAREIKKSREMMERVKEVDAELRDLLNMKSRKEIVKEATGGPSKDDRYELEFVLNNKKKEITQEEIYQQTRSLFQEINDQFSSYTEIKKHIKYVRELYSATPSIWPTAGQISSRFGERQHPWGYEDFHPGLDIANRNGTSICATADGTVQFVGWNGGYGKLVVLDHGYGFTTLYGHNTNIIVKQGQRVKRGQVIARMGSTGRATGPHLHYEVRLNGVPVNPIKFMQGG